jgi:hypothetical protein
MRNSGSTRGAVRRASRRSGAQPLSLFSVVDGDRIPARCFGEPLRIVAAARRRWTKACDALCRRLSRNRQVGLTTVDVDGAPRVAAVLPIGRVLAVAPLRAEYTRALASGLRRRSRARRSHPIAPGHAVA